jgi:hypothetical protein
MNKIGDLKMKEKIIFCIRRTYAYLPAFANVNVRFLIIIQLFFSVILLPLKFPYKRSKKFTYMPIVFRLYGKWFVYKLSLYTSLFLHISFSMHFEFGLRSHQYHCWALSGFSKVPDLRYRTFDEGFRARESPEFLIAWLRSALPGYGRNTMTPAKALQSNSGQL